IAASTALPPFSKMCAPACDASGDSEATIPLREMTIDRACPRPCANTLPDASNATRPPLSKILPIIQSAPPLAPETQAFAQCCKPKFNLLCQFTATTYFFIACLDGGLTRSIQLKFARVFAAGLTGPSRNFRTRTNRPLSVYMIISYIPEE